MKILTKLCRRHKTRFWGRNYFVTPRLVDWIHGDGLQVVSLTPLNTRPNYYLVRVDSREDFDGDAWLDLLEEGIYPAIEEQFGLHHDTWQHDNGRTYTRRNPWPALNDDSGCAWDSLVVLKTPDRRTEAHIRQDILRTRR